MTIGIPGSGKSTWINSIKDQYTIICPDEIRKSITGNISDQTRNDEIWFITKNKVIDELFAGHDVILDACNVNTKFRLEFLSGLPECHKVARVFKIDPGIAYQRIQEDIRKGVDRSNVPESTIYKMYGEFLFTEKALQYEFESVIYGSNSNLTVTLSYDRYQELTRSSRSL